MYYGRDHLDILAHASSKHMSESTQKKVRSTPNPNVSIEHYKNIMVDWLRTVDGNLQLHLGPQLCKKQTAVNAGHLIRVRSLLTAFLNSGLKNGVLNASRLEAGIRGSLSHALDKIDAGVNADLFSHQFAEHLRFCFNTLRFYKMEKVTPLHVVCQRWQVFCDMQRQQSW